MKRIFQAILSFIVSARKSKSKDQGNGMDKASQSGASSRQSATTGQASARLQTLREQELSIGADFRRGLSPSKAPGQTLVQPTNWFDQNSKAAPAATSGHKGHYKGNYTAAPACGVHRSVSADARESISSDDFALSAAVAASTGSTSLGYLAGGSFAGAAIGGAIGGAVGEACAATHEQAASTDYCVSGGDSGGDSCSSCD